eukprot:363116-Chlamydomonas_euryale.AAC.10
MARDVPSVEEAAGASVLRGLRRPVLSGDGMSAPVFKSNLHDALFQPPVEKPCTLPVPYGFSRPHTWLDESSSRVIGPNRLDQVLSGAVCWFTNQPACPFWNELSATGSANLATRLVGSSCFNQADSAKVKLLKQVRVPVRLQTSPVLHTANRQTTLAQGKLLCPTLPSRSLCADRWADGSRKGTLGGTDEGGGGVRMAFGCMRLWPARKLPMFTFRVQVLLAWQQLNFPPSHASCSLALPAAATLTSPLSPTQQHH